MSFSNPTPVKVGMVGTFAGKSHRVAGRVVMGMDDEGETYYWQEFNLVADDGDFITLVYEPTESGGDWRLFTLFEPENPMSVQEAATKRVGDQVNLEGHPVRVTLVDESQVYYIEGEAPEGVEVGDVAHYFNAETANKMQVASWTGDEIEFYRGVDLKPATVAAALNVQIKSPGATFLSGGQSASPSSGVVVKVVIAFLGLAILLGGYASCRPTRQRTVVRKTNAPTSPLRIGGSGKLDGTTWQIRNHALVEAAQVGRLCDRHEYQLLDESGNRVLLVHGFEPGANDWALFTALEPLEPLTPRQAAALRAGERVNLDGFVAPVSEISQYVFREVEGAELPDLKPGAILYGFRARTGSTLLLARWNESGIHFYRGKPLPAKEVVAAFSAPGAR